MVNGYKLYESQEAPPNELALNLSRHTRIKEKKSQQHIREPSQTNKSSKKANGYRASMLLSNEKALFVILCPAVVSVVRQGLVATGPGHAKRDGVCGRNDEF
jgi:hypothetical protein